MRTVLNIMAIAVLAVSCVSSPSGGKTPGWVLQTPAPDGTYTYFVGSSSDASGNAVTAGNDAAFALYQRCGFIQYGLEPLAVRVGVDYFDKIHMWREIRVE